MKNLNKTIVMVICALAMLCTKLNAQNLVALQSGNTSTFYTTIDDAITAANNGDFIYVPGGVWAINNQIHKGVNIVGVGYNGDSTTATGTTKITGNGFYGIIRISSGSDNGSFTGVQFLHSVMLGGDESVGTTAVNNYSFSRCRFSGGNSGWCDNNVCLFMGWCGSAASTNSFLSENIFEGVVKGYGISGVTFVKNIFTNYIDQFNASTFNNNIFMVSAQWKFFNTNTSAFNNNIVIDNNGYPNFMNPSCSGNVITNTIYSMPNNQGVYNNTEVGGIYSANPIFVNFTGFSYDIHADYHLAPASPGINYGTDGTDVGLYGTAVPFKAGGVPFNTHIQMQSIGTSTDSQGHLPVNIHVAAQGN